ncbi:hypothetical protein ACOSP7_015890 [Xanthoceras sorbifolium]
MEEKKKVTFMLLKVDLQCSKCYKKVKKVLCQFPQIQDQVYDEKNNTVMIKVVCCSPEKIRDKICCKGRGSIKSIEILKPPEKKPDQKPKEPEKKPADKPKEPEKKPADKPKEPEKKPADKPKEPEKKPADKPKEPEKKPEKPKESEKPKEKPANPPKPDKPKVTFEQPPPPNAPANPPKPDKPNVTFEQPPPPKAPQQPQLLMGYPPCYPPVPGRSCCSDCYEGRSGGSCYDNQCYGQPIRYYDGYSGRPVYDSWGGGGYRGYSERHCSEYFCEENAQACTIM